MPSYASFMVGYIELNEDAKAREYLTRMYNHFSGPFLVGVEYPQATSAINNLNTFNYLPAYAAFASGFMSAYCGVRYRDFQLDIVYPSEQYGAYQGQGINKQYPVFTQPAPNVDNWNITGLLYRGNKIDIIYNLRSKSVEFRNRRSNDPQLIADDSLEIAVYEGTEHVRKNFKIGDTVMVSINPDTWTYAAKKRRLQTKNSYSDNLHILASIYSTSDSKHVVRPRNTGLKLAHSSTSLVFSFLALLTFYIAF